MKFLRALIHRIPPYTKWLFLYALFVILLAGSINLMLYLPIPSHGSIDSTHWLGFWGSFLGSSIACIPAILALNESRRQARQQHEEVQAQLEASRKHAEMQSADAEEIRRLSVMPVLDISFRFPDYSDTSFFTETFIEFNADNRAQNFHLFNRSELAQHIAACHADHFLSYAILKNHGYGLASEITLHIPNYDPMPLGSFGTNDSFDFVFAFPRKTTITAKLSFSDIFGRHYFQNLVIKYEESDDSYSFSPATYPILESSFK
ncbi:MAG: hypothetical protein MJ074_06660 [Oscillospiraceae bacterium]|nr:hypothetical protein [Oscillospiraceae bacterium]